MQKPSARIRIVHALQWGAALTGVVLSIVLLVEHTRLKGGFQGSSFCSFGEWADCNAVSASRYSEILGIPLAAIGAIYFFTLLALSAIGRPFVPAFGRAQALGARLSFLGLLVDVVLFFVQVFAIQRFCILCLSTYICATVYWVTSAWMNAVRLGGSMNPLSWFRTAFTVEPKSSRIPKQSKAFAVFAGVLFTGAVALVPTWAAPETQRATSGPTPQATLENLWNTTPKRTIAVGPLDGQMGNPHANVQITVFSDFECPHCQRAASDLQRVVSPIQGEVNLVFKNFPLDSHCNPALSQPMHPNACAFAQLGVCAAKKGKFWQFHDTVFFSMQNKGLREKIETYQDPLAQVFTPAEFKACLADNEARRKVEQDVSLGNSADFRISATPSIFINGKKSILPLGTDNLMTLIRWEQALAGKR